MKLKLPTLSNLPTVGEMKTAGLADGGMAALLGAVFSTVTQAIPAVANMRTTNPTAYDALLATSVAAAMSTLKSPPAGDPRPGIIEPGALQGPGWRI